MSRRFTIPAPTLPELGAGTLLAVLAMLELFRSSATAHEHQARRVVVPLLVCLLLGWLRKAPLAVVAVWSVLFTFEGLVGRPTELLSVGLASMAIGFGFGAFGRVREWPIGGVLFLVAWLTRDLFNNYVDPGDAFVDLVLTLLAFAVGAVVHVRTTRAAQLADELEVSATRSAEAADAAVAAERARIARELHDIVAHAVSIIVVQAGTSRPLAQRVDARLDETLSVIEETGREALVELRRLVEVLRPASETGSEGASPLPGLADIATLVERVSAAGLPVEYDAAATPDLDPGLALAIYRVVQEGLTNALRHGGRSAHVSITAIGEQINVIVENTTQTSPAAGSHGSSAIAGTGTGLVGLRERVELFGGVLRASSQGHGFVLTATFPHSERATSMRDVRA